ncbi:hypothetical protein EHM76_02950 [bacterium]|nr:MAG: hypothetical protein EHM76_02950 [bacterium]
MVRSYKLIEKAEFPSAINPVDLDTHPIALTIPAAVQPMYAMGRKHLTWFGVTEFHVAPDLDRGRMPSLVHWFSLILRAAAANVQLGGIVENFVIVDRPDGIEGPLALKYGDEAAHWGFTVKWMVEEVPTNSNLPVSA